jgi:hypothetical protein
MKTTLGCGLLRTTVSLVIVLKTALYLWTYGFIGLAAEFYLMKLLLCSYIGYSVHKKSIASTFEIPEDGQNQLNPAVFSLKGI